MTRLEIIFGLGNLVLPVLTYFAGVCRTEKHYRQKEAEAKIDDIVKTYMEASKAGKRSGLDGLLKAGVGNLKSDKEIREVCRRITGHGDHSPLSALGNYADKIDLHRFFRLTIDRKINLYTTPDVQKLINELAGATDAGA